MGIGIIKEIKEKTFKFRSHHSLSNQYQKYKQLAQGYKYRSDQLQEGNGKNEHG